MIRTALVSTLLLSLFAAPARAEEVKVGIVDLRRALGETEEGRKARARLKKDFDKKQKELDEQQEELKKAIEDLNKKRTLLPAETVRQKETELQERVGKVQQTYLRHQQDLASKEEEATAPIVDRLHRIIGRIAAAENFTVVLDKSAGVVFSKPHLDLTNEVIRRFNAGEEKSASSKKSAGDSKKKKK
ncbi:MAG: OmpH family outer membrane protein [Deltaproteobacteria bacterium]|jgi:outer membrane protein|nr:OmpH family outer membrane protein [Deltaproteobacteria bacterium]